jgi:predicted transcriptional regulator
LKLTSNGETLAESKVLILYILNNVKKAINNNTLYKIVLSVLDMNYFYFQQFLLDLVKSDFVLTYEQEDQNMYLITEKGITTLELTEDILPGILKLQVDTNLKYTLDDVDEENSIVAEYTPVNENYYNVTCKIMENNECLFEVKTFAGSREQAKQIVENWKKHAGTMYPNLLEILTQDFQDDDLETPSEPINETIIGSPRDVYNYDVINRNSTDNEVTNNDTNSDKTNLSTNNSYVIEGNMSLFDFLDNTQNNNDNKK